MGTVASIPASRRKPLATDRKLPFGEGLNTARLLFVERLCAQDTASMVRSSSRSLRSRGHLLIRSAIQRHTKAARRTTLSGVP